MYTYLSKRNTVFYNLLDNPGLLLAHVKMTKPFIIIDNIDSR